MKGSQHPHATPRQIHEILSPLVGKLTVARRPSAEEADQVWRKLVGRKAASHSRPRALRGGELMVAVDSSVWLWHLSLQRQRLLEGLRAAWGQEAVSTIRLRMRSAEDT